jgi:hypothetical protein
LKLLPMNRNNNMMWSCFGGKINSSKGNFAHKRRREQGKEKKRREKREKRERKEKKEERDFN